MSTRYFSAQQLSSLLAEHGLCTELYGAFPVDTGSWRARVISALKRAAVSLHLVPKTMKGKEVLKRIFLGPLVHAPAEVADGIESYHCPVALDANHRAQNFKLLFAVGHLAAR